jgi:hypothetical protein
MNPLDYLKGLVEGASKNIPAPVQRFAGQVFNKIPVAINPIRTRQPTTTLGRIGKEINPLNPRNLAIIALSEAVNRIAGKTLPPEAAARVEYMTYGPQLGLALNVLDAGSAGAAPLEEQRRIQESLAYFAASERQKGNTAPPPTPGPRIESSTTQAIQTGALAPKQSAQIVPVTPTAPPTPVISPAAYGAVQAGFEAPTNLPLSEFYGAQRGIGEYAEQGGELQRRLKEVGGASGMSDTALMEWVRANPALAYRELIRREKRPTPNMD